MDRKGYYVKPARRRSAPGLLFSVCVEPSILDINAHPDRQCRVWGNCHVWKTRRHGNTWARPTEFVTTDPNELWAWMHSHGRRNCRNYVVSPIASDTLTLSEWWQEAEAGGTAWQPVGSTKQGSPEDGVTRFRRLVLRGVPDVIDYTRYGYRWIWLSGRQYLPMDEEQIARSLGIRWIDTERHETPDSRLLRTARERSHLWIRAMMLLTEWWQTNATASFGFTAGQLAMGVMRSHVEPKTLCTHKDERVWALEREAAFGGRASTWFVGDVGDVQASGTAAIPSPTASKFGNIPGPLFHLDVRSMYPTLLRDRAFPRKLWSYRENPPRGEPQDAAESYGVIARVTIETKRAEYPRRNGSRIEYPLGRFTTTLTGPELIQLRKDGKVLKCHAMALYDVGQVFKASAGALIEMREKARAEGNIAWEYFAKLLGNSMGGKLAQRGGRWLERRKHAPKAEWGEWFEGRGDNGKPRRFRSIAGLVWEWVTDPAGAGPHTAAFDYLTAFGRLQMRAIRELCPARSVISQDTDGIWVLEAAVDALKRKGVPFGDSAGELRISEYSDCGRFFGPRHYYTNGNWILAGFHAPSVAMDGTAVEHTHEMNPIRGGTGDAPRMLFTVSKRAVLKLDIPNGIVGNDGWVSPKQIG